MGSFFRAKVRDLEEYIVKLKQQVRNFSPFKSKSVSCETVFLYSLALLAESSKTLPLPGFESPLGHVRKLSVTWDWVVVFAGYSSFLHHLRLASHK